MKNKLIASLIILSPNIFAHDLPNTFEAGQPIVASEVNENFAEIESELDNLTSQVETLQSTITNVAENVSTEIEFVGFSTEALFGKIGLKAGRSMCSNAFPGSHICSVDELDNLKNWSSFNIVSPFILAMDSESPNPCGRYNSTYSSNSGYGYMKTPDNLRVSKTSESSFYISMPSDSPSGTWVINNTSNIDSCNGNQCVSYDSNENTHAFTSSNNESIAISVCNVSLPAACCK